MTTDVRLDRLLERRRRALAEHMTDALAGDVESVHQARVATRRLREVLPLVLAEAPSKRMSKLLRTVRRLTRALGAVREFDVSSATLASIVGHTPEVGDARALALSLARRRRRALEALTSTFGQRRRAERLLTRLAEVVEAVSNRDDSSAWRSELVRRVEARSKKLRLAVETAGALYAPERLHALRIATKQLRYALELAGELRLSHGRPLVTTLKRSQDVLGRLHDLDVLMQVIRGHKATDGQVRDALVVDLDRQCRVLHAQFMQGRSRLIVVADAAADALAAARQAAARRTPAARSRRTPAASSRRVRAAALPEKDS